MRDPSDRRAPQPTDQFPFSLDSIGAQRERRHSCERRIENLNAEERQLMLSEMPAPSESLTSKDEQD